MERLIDSRASKRARHEDIPPPRTVETARATAKSLSNENLGTKNVGVVAYSESCDEDSPLVSDHPKVPLSTIVADDSYENTSKVESPVRAKTVERHKRARLEIGDCSDKLKDEMKELRQFYQRTLNPNRRGPAFAATTLDKMEKRRTLRALNAYP